MLDRIREFADKWQMFKKEDCVITGVSGGADSVCLLFVLLDLQKRIGFRLVAVHVNHGLRGAEADRDEAYVKKICEENQVEYICYHENVDLFAKKWKQSTEEAGRNVRRACFQKAAEACGGTKIALAHHKNDNAETFLLNLARGTGLKGLGGIAPMQGNIVRPLLCVERKEIEAYLEEEKICYCTDSTNSSNDYTRNRIRNHILPYMEEEVNGRAVAHMDETMTYLREVQEYLESQLDEHWNVCVEEEDGSLLLKKEEYLKVPKVLQSMMLKKILAKTAGQEKDIETVHVKMLEELLEKQSGRKVDLPYEVEGKRVYEGIRLLKKGEKPEEILEEVLFDPDKEAYTLGKYQITCRLITKEEIQNNTENGSKKWFDYDIIKNGLSFRMRRPGDYITIHEDGRSQKLKSYFINEKIPQEERDGILLAADGSHILWILGHRVNCVYRVTESTNRVLEIAVNKGE